MKMQIYIFQFHSIQFNLFIQFISNNMPTDLGKSKLYHGKIVREELYYKTRPRSFI